MEYAKKLALVDPRLLNQQQQQHVEYKEIQKAADVQAKTGLSLEMRRILDDDTLSDDIKCKLYRQALDRYLRVSDSIPEQTINPIVQPVRKRASPRKRMRSSRKTWLQY
jgi:hypothetical protein